MRHSRLKVFLIADSSAESPFEWFDPLKSFPLALAYFMGERSVKVSAWGFRVRCPGPKCAGCTFPGLERAAGAAECLAGLGG